MNTTELLKGYNDIKENWIASRNELKQLSPNGYRLPTEDDSNNHKQRFKDLIGLLGILYENERNNKELYLNKHENLNTYHNYIKTNIIDHYPYKCYGAIRFIDKIDPENTEKKYEGVVKYYNKINKKYTEEDFLYKNISSLLVFHDLKITAEEWDNWIDKIFRKSGRLSHIPKLTYDITNLDKTIELRLQRIYDLAKVVHYLNKVYFNGIQHDSLIYKPSNSIYGNKYAMSAFIGMHIMREFPFKDMRFKSPKNKMEIFESMNLVKELAKNPKSPTIYEHYTPTAIFGKLLALDILIPLETWFMFIYERYRTVLILKSEDENLTKSHLRDFDEYEKNNKIEIMQEPAWKKIHKIDEDVIHFINNKLS